MSSVTSTHERAGLRLNQRPHESLSSRLEIASEIEPKQPEPMLRRRRIQQMRRFRRIHEDAVSTIYLARCPACQQGAPGLALE